MTFGSAVAAAGAALAAIPPTEWVAVLLALGYLLLAVRQNAWCWACAIASSAIFLVLFARGGLLMQAVLQVFYVAMGAYKIELWSTAYEGWGLDPLPHYKEPVESPVSTPELYRKYPLIMISGTRSSLFFLSEHRMIPWLREKEQEPFVEIHPDTAREYGIYDGEWITSRTKWAG